MSDKPTGGKAYGSIGHLPNSRIGPGDHHVTEGQARICTLKTRDKHDRVIVQEKLDGSCTAVALVNGVIEPLSRAGYRALTSPYVQHHYFAHWVYENEARFRSVLREGERLCGEWLAQAHGTRYLLPHEPWVAFDLFSEGKRVRFADFRALVSLGNFVIPRILSEGEPLSVEAVLAVLEPSGHGAMDPVEGAVWRVERKGVVDFLAKYVRHDKVDGCYLPEQFEAKEVWNWTPQGSTQ